MSLVASQGRIARLFPPLLVGPLRVHQSGERVHHPECEGAVSNLDQQAKRAVATKGRVFVPRSMCPGHQGPVADKGENHVSNT